MWKKANGRSTTCQRWFGERSEDVNGEVIIDWVFCDVKFICVGGFFEYVMSREIIFVILVLDFDYFGVFDQSAKVHVISTSSLEFGL